MVDSLMGRDALPSMSTCEHGFECIRRLALLMSGEIARGDRSATRDSLRIEEFANRIGNIAHDTGNDVLAVGPCRFAQLRPRGRARAAVSPALGFRVLPAPRGLCSRSPRPASAIVRGVRWTSAPQWRPGQLALGGAVGAAGHTQVARDQALAAAAQLVDEALALHAETVATASVSWRKFPA